jgi:hypothetical protein
MRGKHGSRARTRFSRIAVLLVVLAFGGPKLWAALRTMPTPLVEVLGLYSSLPDVLKQIEDVLRRIEEND